jgi:biopolymer transport protein ExbD
MSGSVSSEANAEPNLTPMLDMVFQLITFFMLVMNFKAASLDLNLKLPVVGSARMVESKGYDLVVLNVDQKGTLRVYGEEKSDIEKYIQNEALSSVRTANDKNEGSKKFGDELDSIVVVRADRATPFKKLNRVIKACQDNGFRNFALKAMNKAEEK